MHPYAHSFYRLNPVALKMVLGCILALLTLVPIFFYPAIPTSLLLIDICSARIKIIYIVL